MGKLLKIVRIGDEVGVILPPEVLAELKAQLGDQVRVEKQAEISEMHHEISDAEFARQMEIARQVMDRRRRALQELAK